MQNTLLSALSHEYAISGEALAQQFGVTRAAIHKRIQQLKARGVIVEASVHGYQLGYPYAWWHEQAIKDRIGCPLTILDEVVSTSDTARAVMRDMTLGSDGLWLTDFQTAGRGRRGNHWLSMPGRQLTFSYAISTPHPPQTWTGLSLAVGVVLAEQLAGIGLTAALKWPNDVMLGDEKLGGILIEMDAQAEGPSTLIIGVGVNEHFSPEERQQVGVPVAALRDVISAYDRVELLVSMVNALRNLTQSYAQATLEHYRERWSRIDYLYSADIQFQQDGAMRHGRARGINSQGALLIEAHGDLLVCSSTEIEKIRK